MKTKDPTSPEFRAFKDLLKQVLSVSHSELQTRMKEYKKARRNKPKTGPKPKTVKPSADRASSGLR